MDDVAGVLEAARDAYRRHDWAAARRELDAAEVVLERLGATLDVREVAARRGPAALPGGLTGREAEVLALVAAGRSNREIAAVLVLSPTTPRATRSTACSWPPRPGLTVRTTPPARPPWPRPGRRPGA